MEGQVDTAVTFIRRSTATVSRPIMTSLLRVRSVSVSVVFRISGLIFVCRESPPLDVVEFIEARFIVYSTSNCILGRSEGDTTRRVREPRLRNVILCTSVSLDALFIL